MSNDKTVAMFPGEDGHRRSTENSDKRRCMGCMELYDKKWELCPHCGYPANATADSPLHMSPGSILNGRYEVGRVLGNGGFRSYIYCVGSHFAHKGGDKGVSPE